PVGCWYEPRRAACHFGIQRRLGGGAQNLGLFLFRTWIGHEYKSLEMAGIFAFDQNLAIAVYSRHKILILAQTFHQDAGAPIDKALRQSLVERVRQPILYITRALLPMRWIVKPIGPVGHIGPGPHMGKAGGERINVPVGAVKLANLARKPVIGD